MIPLDRSFFSSDSCCSDASETYEQKTPAQQIFKAKLQSKRTDKQQEKAGHQIEKATSLRTINAGSKAPDISVLAQNLAARDPMPDLSWKKKSQNAMEQLQKELSPVRNRISSLRLIKLSRDNSDRLPIEPIGEPTTPLDKIFN